MTSAGPTLTSSIPDPSADVRLIEDPAEDFDNYPHSPAGRPCLCNLNVNLLSLQLYIVYLGDVKHGHPDDVVASHHDLLSNVLGSKEDSLASMLHNYKHGFSGFAAMLTEDQASQLAGLDFSTLRAHSVALWQQCLLCSFVNSRLSRGIWPESRSFNDEGYGPVPARWKGVCQVGQGWDRSNCSRKIIGARFYSAGIDEAILKDEYLSARDFDGHGTHTASTTAGSVVEAASFHGLAAGAARGGAPRARIAVYKSLWGPGGHGSSATVLAAIDDAIHDGVDVLSLSLAAPGENSFGALHAVQKGITVVYAAGNDGPIPQTVENTAPWVITVAASKVDRSFPTAITLGNKQQIVVRCTADALNGTDVKGKIVLCLPLERPLVQMPLTFFSVALQNVLDAGGSGFIFAQYELDALDATADCEEGFPCVLVDINTGKLIGKYIDGTSSPMAKIEPARTITGDEVLAPKVASFSSRGPSTDFADIIKPDIAAPGSNIIAAKKNSYAILSRTSMATPHVAGIAALLKALHPKWSPAAIKSAIVTTASVTDERGMPILAEGLPRKVADPFDYGGGHISPNRAAYPGLIYDIDPRYYNYFFGCIITTSASCNSTWVPAYLLNLPSISVPDLRYPVTISRTVTNVGEVDAVYHAAIESPAGVKVEVEPSVLIFNAANKVHTFKVKLSPVWRLQGSFTFGSLTWYNGQKSVRIPIAARITVHDLFAEVA
ncbi:hypothetical protein HU200_007570 [Digitaria exilis]|uniref:Uncharacterized protein n=1 Tax=Digitaria exilis TaxID=1010633 RepID=A0A835KPF3_9POAL|nr:hypothetical protein HU200_007570 [Digitaria exilis]